MGTYTPSTIITQRKSNVFSPETSLIFTEHNNQSGTDFRAQHNQDGPRGCVPHYLASHFHVVFFSSSPQCVTAFSLKFIEKCPKRESKRDFCLTLAEYSNVDNHLMCSDKNSILPIFCSSLSPP